MLINEGGENIKKYPYIKQKGLKECGPACVQMILKYHHGYVSINKLSEMLQTNQNGTTAYHINETLKSLGFNSIGVKNSNLSDLKLPCIAHVIINHSYQHYVVVYKINFKKKTLLIADPATSLKSIKFEEFNKIWTGISIQMYPIKQITYQTEPNILKFIWYYIKKNFKLIILINFTSLFVSFLSIISSLFLPLVVSNINKKFILALCASFLLIFSFKDLFNFIKNKLVINLNLKLDKQLSLDIFLKILNLPYRYYYRKTTGEIVSYFNDLYVVKDVIHYFSQIFFMELPLLIILAIILCCINPFFILLLILNILIYFLIYKLTNNLIIEKMTRQKYQINSYIVEAISGFETIKNLHIQNNINTKFISHYQKFTKLNKQVFNQNNLFSLIKNLIEHFTILIMVILIIQNNHNIHNLIIIYVLITASLNLVKNIFDFEYQLTELKASLNNIAELLIYTPKPLIKSSVNGDIQIKHLNFTYDNKDLILKDINLTIKNASKVFVTGGSGSGKTTLFKILKGYYQNYQGNIVIGQTDIQNHYFQDIIYVSSKEILFTGPLIDNLTLKTKNPDCVHICEIENIAQNNYYQLIEENGFNLSSGQKQRIVLARALCNFNILIIDEGLNQVSIDMERRILKKLFAKYPKKTIIYISHRLDNLDLFDQFIKINKGQIVLNTKRNN